MTTKHTCMKSIWRDCRSQWQPCFRTATVQRDGKWYCWQHDPERMRAKAEKHSAVQQAKTDRDAANAKLATLVTVELATTLERLAHYAYSKGRDWDQHGTEQALENAEQCRREGKAGSALAARIRKALEANDES